MSSARADILAALRAKARAVQRPPVWRSQRQFDDLAGQFTQALVKAHGELIRADSLDAALTQVGDLLDELDAQKVVATSEPPIDGLDLAARYPACDWYVVGQTAGELRAFCAVADAGLSGVDAALAETGTIILRSGPGRSRLATLLPPVHVALLPVSRLMIDIFTWTAARKAQPPAAITLISGPSKSGDIEQTLTVGVHGPKRLIVVLYDDEGLYA